MNTPELDLEPTAIIPEPEQPGESAELPTDKKRPWKLSVSTEAFIAQMAENLRTHDPENPKGRLRKKT